MHLVGYFEGIDSERGLEWRLGFPVATGVPAVGDAGTGAGPVPGCHGPARACPMKSTRRCLTGFPGADRRGGSGELRRAHRGGCLDHEGQRGTAAQHRAEGHGRQVTGGCWRAWPRRAASRHPRPMDLARLDRKRKGKKLSNQDWVSKSDPAGQDRQDGGRHDPSGLKPEHAVDLDTGSIGGGRQLQARPTRATRRRWRRRWRRPRRISRRWTRHRRPK